MKPLPSWTQQGAIIGLEGGSAEVQNITSTLLDQGAPLVGVWLQDWVGTRHDWDGTRLIWNWEVREPMAFPRLIWCLACTVSSRSGLCLDLPIVLPSPSPSAPASACVGEP